MTTEEALAAAQVNDTGADEVITIDNDLRTIIIPASITLLGVVSDENVQTLHFQMPKTYKGLDLSEFDVRINYMNANNVGDVYAVDDNEVSGENIVFTWTVGRVACMYKGNTKFIVCLKKEDASGNVLKEFNTSLTSLPVLDGLETTEAVVAENPDIITQLLKRMREVEKIATKETMQEYVNTYLTEHPGEIDETLTDPKKAAPADVVGSLKEDLTSKADKTALVKTDRKLDALWKLNQGISYQFETDAEKAYQKTIPSGAKLVSVKKIGGRLDNEGTLMSIPVNEVVEHGKNLFDFSRLVSDGVNVMDYEKQTITIPAKTNNTGYNQTLRDLCPGITPGTYVFSMKRSNPNSGNGSYFLEATKDFPVDTPIELTDELLDNHISWYNSDTSEVENVISEIQVEKNSVKTSYSQYHKKSHKIPQAILNLDGYGESGNFVDFVEKKYHKGDKIIDISDIIGDTFQEPFEVEAGGTLTFKNSHGDDYRIPVPSSEEYVISLAEVAK